MLEWRNIFQWKRSASQSMQFIIIVSSLILTCPFSFFFFFSFFLVHLFRCFHHLFPSFLFWFYSSVLFCSFLLFIAIKPLISDSEHFRLYNFLFIRHSLTLRYSTLYHILFFNILLFTLLLFTLFFFLFLYLHLVIPYHQHTSLLFSLLPTLLTSLLSSLCSLHYYFYLHSTLWTHFHLLSFLFIYYYFHLFQTDFLAVFW